jgi:hypothetical protein
MYFCQALLENKGFPVIVGIGNAYPFSLSAVMNSTCIHYVGTRPKYVQVEVWVNMHTTPYTMGKYKRYIHLTAPQIQGRSRTLSLEG